MSQCSHCQADLPGGSRFCPYCAEPTQLATQTSAPTSFSQPSSVSGGRFLPGNVIAERYRIVGLIGAGGMGEIYRADDLKLGQQVALKFLPREFSTDERRRERLMNEVRLALRITHPNICRVYDIGDHDEQMFISMEYVDGEDLSSLLTRIGRMPEERAVQIARQLCSGVAAAHEQGILHRDLKPANIMIDGRGRAKIADFGLAHLSGNVAGEEVRAGTPAYMAPEQLEGTEVTERSDLYSLALVLYELFTGKQAYRGENVREIMQQRSSSPASLQSQVPGLDPAIETAILRALDPDPGNRPSSVTGFAAALPGGDPIAAAIAAGETPSPELLAESGDHGGLSMGRIAICFALALAGLLSIAVFRPRNEALSQIDAPRSVSSLQERAQLTAEELGFELPPEGSTASQVDVKRRILTWAAETPEVLRDGRIPAYTAWYRQSPTRMVPSLLQSRVSWNDPQMVEPGELRLRVDTAARLVHLEYRPDPDEPQIDRSPEDIWMQLFTAAELDASAFQEVPATFVPISFADQRVTWEGPLRSEGREPIQVEMASYQGRPVHFNIVGPWDALGADQMTRGRRPLLSALGIVWILLIIVGMTVLARRNVRNGRADTKGAFRVAGFILIIEMLSYLVGGDYLVGVEQFGVRFFRGLAFVCFLVVTVMSAYLALEPYVRRIWPKTLISWSRLTGGRWRDPLVGQHVLIGMMAGSFVTAVWVFHTRIPGWLGLPNEPLSFFSVDLSRDLFHQGEVVLSQIGGAVGITMVQLAMLVLLRLILRKPWAALIVLSVILSLGQSSNSTHFILDFTIAIGANAIALFILTRLGFLAAVGFQLVTLLQTRILTLDPSAWGGPGSILTFTVLLLVLVAAATIASGDRSFMSEPS